MVKVIPIITEQQKSEHQKFRPLKVYMRNP
jgi:hypothetical protein